MKDPKDLISEFWKEKGKDKDMTLEMFISKVQIESYNEGIRSAAKVFYYHDKTMLLSTKSASAINSSILELINDQND